MTLIVILIPSIPCFFSSLFPDVVNCMQTDNLELKKLVYLYLMNYAKSQPDMAIMAVNSFVKVRIAVKIWIKFGHQFTVVLPNSTWSEVILPFFFRTVRIQTLWSALWLCAQWAVSVWTRSLSTCASLCESVWRMKTPMWGRPLQCAWPNCMTSTPRWWRTRASWIPSGTWLLILTPWLDNFDLIVLNAYFPIHNYLLISDFHIGCG